MTAFDAVILVGGSGERLGGLDKALVTVGDRTMIDVVLEASADAARTICVGPERPTARPVAWTSEDPPGGGPVAGVAAGLGLVEAPIVTVLAVDLPFVTPAIVRELAGSVDGDRGIDMAIAVDEQGAIQPLLAAYRAEPLRARLRDLGEPEGASMHRLIDRFVRVELPAGDAARDLDTPEDLAAARDEVG